MFSIDHKGPLFTMRRYKKAWKIKSKTAVLFYKHIPMRRKRTKSMLKTLKNSVSAEQ
jgi:hypothetical protein